MSSDDIAIYVSPQGGVDDMYFTAGLTQAKKPGIVDLKDALPPLWEGKYQGHFFAFDNTLPESVRATLLGITHLALLEGPIGGVGEFFFAGDAIQHNGLIVYFREATQTYFYLHDYDSAVVILKWITDQQDAWAKNPRPAALAA